MPAVKIVTYMVQFRIKYTLTWQKNDFTIYLLLGIMISIIQFILFKYLYPFPDLSFDSYAYIFAAKLNLNVSFLPIGYSKFLYLLHKITHWDTALVMIQYSLYVFSALYLLYTIYKINSPSIRIKLALFILLICNPISLYVCNSITSEAIFIPLSILWFTELLWMSTKPSVKHVILNSILLFLCITLTPVSIFYILIIPIVSLMTKSNIPVKIAGILTPIILIIPFIINSKQASKKMTDGSSIFSFNEGWQVANNALFIRPFIDLDTAAINNLQVKEVDRLALKFYADQGKDLNDYLNTSKQNIFIENAESPLNQYYQIKHSPRTSYEKVVMYGKTSLIFSKYGGYIVSKYPIKYLRYFILKNIRNYLWPSTKNIESYNSKQNDVFLIGQDWFSYPTSTIDTTYANYKTVLFGNLPYVFLFFNVFFIGSLCWGIIKRRSGNFGTYSSTVIIGSTLFLINFIFSICISIVELKTQLLTLFLLPIILLLQLDWLDKLEKSLIENTRKITNKVPSIIHSI